MERMETESRYESQKSGGGGLVAVKRELTLVGSN